jgi:lipopolysaccharide/colanic/teichoic acid biosynthesis glycosyltransferase
MTSMTAYRDDLSGRLDCMAKRLLDAVGAAVLLVMTAPVFALIALTVKLESRGPVLYRCSRVGLGGREIGVLKFRKMHRDAVGPALTIIGDQRFTRIGRLLAKTKLDELPQLWNVLRGHMSLVGPRPEDPRFVELRRDDFRVILSVRPGITGLSQLAFAKESELLDPARRTDDYIERFFPQKIAIDCLYVARRTVWRDLRILTWTVVAVLLRKDVAVNRQTAGLTLRRRPALPQLGAAPVGRS